MGARCGVDQHLPCAALVDANVTKSIAEGVLLVTSGAGRFQALSGALQSAGITNPTFLKAAQAMLSGSVKLGEDGTAYVETSMGPKVLADFVKGWAASDGKDFVTPPSGGGSKGNENGTKGTTMKRADFERLSPDQQMKAIKDSVSLTD